MLNSDSFHRFQARLSNSNSTLDAENEAVVKQFDGQRTSGVAGALQRLGLHKVSIVEREIGSMWTSNETGRWPQ
jgi:hypothetical protein